jgi:CxxC motif-containing protein (DUF1111 family)
VDAAMAQAGQELFTHEWAPGDSLASGGDGLGPVFNATSCVACHNQAGAGGGGDAAHNVTFFTVRTPRPGMTATEGVIHAHATEPKYQETLSLVDASLPERSRPSVRELVVVRGDSSHCIPMPPDAHISQRNTPALFGAKLIDEIPESILVAQERNERWRWGMTKGDDENLPIGRVNRLASGRVGRFGWKAQTASLSDFVQAACANELGLGNPGQAQPRSLRKPDYQPASLDLTQEQCDQLTAFCASLPKPMERLPEEALAHEQVQSGKKLFRTIGCADCHVPSLGSVEEIYSDLLVHKMGRDLVGSGSYGQRPVLLPDIPSGDGPQESEWRTPPLWGVADSAPYLHDGRASTLQEAIQLHGGQAVQSVQKFIKLGNSGQAQLLAFLGTLRAPQ